MSYIMQRLEGHVIECEGRNGSLSVYVNGRCVNGRRRLDFALGVLLGVLLMCISGCSDRPDPSDNQDSESVQLSESPRPGAVYRTNLAWYYCDRTDSHILMTRAPIIDGRVQQISHSRVFLDWMADCEDLAVEWDEELNGRERWND